MRLFKKLSDAFESNKIRQNIPIGIDYKDIEEFQSILFEEHEIARNVFEKTKDNDFANIAIDCLITINQLERLKLRMAIKNKI